MKENQIEIDEDYSSLVISFCESQKLKVLKRILEYINYSDNLSCYFFFGYEEYNIDIDLIDQYKAKYEGLKENQGFIKLKNEDYKNLQLISDLLNEYQLAMLYINEYSDLDKKYTFNDIRKSNISFDGYIISEMREDYIVLQKATNKQDWNFKKMGIILDSIDYKISSDTDTPQDFEKEISLGKHIFKYYNLRRIGIKKLLIGNITINDKKISEYFFTAPFLYSESFIIIPLYLSGIFPKFTLARICLKDNSLDFLNVKSKVLYLKEVNYQNVFFYKRLNKTEEDYVKMSRTGIIN